LARIADRLTFDDLEAIPEERPGDRHELIDGELVVTPLPTMNHQSISSNLVYALERIVREQDLGRVYAAPTGIRFTPNNVLFPDIMFIARNRLHIRGPKTVDAPPDLVVEILSPGTRQRDLTVKRDLYAQFGVHEYWVVDPEARTVTVLTLKGDRYEPVPPGDDGAIASRVLPGLTLALKDVFAGVQQ
jgi:Uma2 family endonuclease